MLHDFLNNQLSVIATIYDIILKFLCKCHFQCHVARSPTTADYMEYYFSSKFQGSIMDIDLIKCYTSQVYI